jgi:hypothetical protein
VTPPPCRPPRHAKRRLPGRKLLVASIGVATVHYAAACYGSESSGNLVAPPVGDVPPRDSGPPPTSGNLVAPPPPPGLPDAGRQPPPELDAGVDPGDDAGADPSQ